MAEEQSKARQKKHNLAYTKEVNAVIEDQQTSPEEGLSSTEVEERRQKYGINEIPDKEQAGWLEILIKQFKDFLILILFLAAGISFFAGQMANGYIILGVIVFNAVMGFLQEYKAEQSVASIKQMVKHSTTLIRDGEKQTIESRWVVPGDIIVLEEGSTVSADCRLLEGKNLRTGEASLTGESEPVGKSTKPLEEDTELAERENMAYKGTHVVRGSGKAVAVAIGEQTEIGKIAEALQGMEEGDSNFKKKTARLGKKMAGIAIVTASLVFALGYFYRNFELQDIVLVTIASLVSSIPEGLPVVTSIVLAIGANRMADRNALIREFTATEVLGSVSTILTDKTGTITQSVLTVKRLFTGEKKEYGVEGKGYALEGSIKAGTEEDSKTVDKEEEGPAFQRLMEMAYFCNQATVHTPSDEEKKNTETEVSGDPTEVGLKVLGMKGGMQQQAGDYKVLDDLPFNSKQKFRATLVETPKKGKVIFVVGAPEKILEISTRYHQNDGTKELDEEMRQAIEEKNYQWADEALRVIGLAYLPVDEATQEIQAEHVENLTWTGIVGIIDPPREQVRVSVEECHHAGIRVIMVTGDHRKTAAAIARQVAIIGEEDDNKEQALSENDIKALSDEELDQKLSSINVFARVNPNTKLRIAERFQENGALIAMTGDGVNDAPALKRADVGIAMGQKGTDTARDAAKIVLSNDNFASIVSAIKEGRIVFKNIRSTSYFLLTTNFASAFTLIVSLLLGFPIPLTAVQILWVNMVTDGIMDVAKATEKGHGDIMDRKPIRKDEPILTWSVLPYLVIMAIIMVTLTVFTFDYYLPQGVEIARTGAFFIIAMTQVFNVYNMRDLNKSVFEIGFFTNKWINVAFVTSFILQLAVVKVPFLQKVFGFGEISYLDFAVITLLSTSVLWAGELYKWVQRKRNKQFA